MARAVSPPISPRTTSRSGSRVRTNREQLSRRARPKCLPAALPAWLPTHGFDEEMALPVDGAEALLFDLEQRIGQALGFQSVAEVGRQNGQLLPLCNCRIASEECLDLAAGKASRFRSYKYASESHTRYFSN